MAYKIASTEVPNALASGQPELRARTDRDGAPKLSPSGRRTFSSGVQPLREGGGFEAGATIAVIEVPDTPWPVGTRLRAEGDAWLVPYVTQQGRLGLSFTVDRLVPVTSAPAMPTRAPHKPDND